jgi:hypothetical protein
VALLLVAFGAASLVLVAVTTRQSTAWPLLYARIVGSCALVSIVYAVAAEGRRPVLGALVAGLGAALVISGSSAALADDRAGT